MRNSFSHRLARAASGLVVGLLWLASLLLSPLSISRLLRKVSLPRFSTQPLRTILTIAGIASGVAAVVAVVVVNRSVLRSATGVVEDIGGTSDLQISGSASGVPDALLDTVRTVPGVEAATPVIQQVCVIGDTALQGERLVLVGQDLIGGNGGKFRPNKSPDLDAIRRDPLSFLNSDSNIIITQALARRAQRTVHQHIALSTPAGTRHFEIWGILKSNNVASSFGGMLALMDYQAMQVAFGRGRDVDRIDIKLASGTDIATARAALRAAVGPAYVVERPEERGVRIRGMLAGLQASLSTASLIALFIGMFLIYNTMVISIAQRQQELGLLRALGTTRADLVWLVTCEGAVLGIAGSALGLVLGVGVAGFMLRGTAQAISRIYLAIATAAPEIDATLLGTCFLVGVAVSTAAAAHPARKAARISPGDTLRSSRLLLTATAEPGQIAIRDFVGLTFFGAAALSLGLPAWAHLPIGGYAACVFLLGGTAILMPRFVRVLHSTCGRLVAGKAGVALRMATLNVPRDLARSSITASAVMLGVAMATSFAIFIGSFVFSTVAWLDQSVVGDLFISRTGPGAATASVPEGLADALERMPGVEGVERVRIADVQLRGAAIKLISTDLAQATRYAKTLLTEGNEREALPPVIAGKGALVSENLSHKLNLHRGDRVELAAGGKVIEFEITGVRVDYTSDLGTLMIDRKTYVSAFGDHLVDSLNVHARAGADVEAIRRSINQRYAQEPNLLVLTGREFKTQAAQLLERIFTMVRALQSVSILIAALGILNTLLASTLDRTREFGILRACGMRRRQLRRMIFAEAVLLGASGGFPGVLAGTALGYIITHHISTVFTGWTFLFRPNWQSLVEVVVILLTSCVVAGWYPARKAAALPVATALSSE